MRTYGYFGFQALFLWAALIAAEIVEAQTRRMEGDITATAVRGSVHMLQMGSAGNVGVLTGPDGAVLIDDQFAPMTPRIQEAVAN